MRLGLVLSGGGASGVGHIPVLEALDDLQVTPTVIAGTSIGAMIGAMFGAGLSGSAIRDHFLYMGSRPAAKMWKIAMQGALGINRGLVAVDAEAFTDAFMPAAVPKRFEDLTIPLTTVAVDFHARKAVGVSSGPLYPAIAASIAIPGVFKPVRMQDRVYVDGGIIANMPLDFLPEVDVTLAVDVFPDPPSDSLTMPSQIEAAMGSFRTMMATQVAASIDRKPPDILIRPNIVSHGLLTLWKIEDVLAGAEGARAEARTALERALNR